MAREPWFPFLAAWALWTPVFFTFASNVLWTYLFPALPAFSLIAARYVVGFAEAAGTAPWRFRWAAAITPAAAVMLTIGSLAAPAGLKTQAGLVASSAASGGGQVPLFYLGEPPFSGRFYSRDRARSISLLHLSSELGRGKPFFLAMPRHRLPEVTKLCGKPLRPTYENKHYVLIEFNQDEK